MSSFLPAMGTLEMFVRIESAINDAKNHINSLELTRVMAMLNSLKKDEERLSKCINDIEEFHRDLFDLPKKEDKPSDTENVQAMAEEVNSPEYFVTEPRFYENEPMSSRNEEDSSMNEQNSSGPRFRVTPVVIDITSGRSWTCSESSGNEPSSGNDLSSGNELMDTLNEAQFSEEEEEEDESSMQQQPACSMNEQTSFPPRIIVKIPKSKLNMYSSFKESVDGCGSSFSEAEPVVDVQEMAKNALLNLLADKETEVTKLVVHLIFKFSSFRQKLRTTETSIPNSVKFFPANPKVNIHRKLKALSESVLLIDKAISNIYAEYSEMLQNLRKAFPSQT